MNRLQARVFIPLFAITSAFNVFGEIEERGGTADLQWSGPLGSDTNPVRAWKPRGEEEYLDRLRCSDGSTPQYNRRGSYGGGSDEHLIDGYDLTCEGITFSVYMDMYHHDHFETAPVDGMSIEASTAESKLSVVGGRLFGDCTVVKVTDLLEDSFVDLFEDPITVLGAVSFELPARWDWSCTDINLPTAKGAHFVAASIDGGPIDAEISVVDVSTDPTEPDVSNLQEQDVSKLDTYLHQGIQKDLEAVGQKLVEWKKSRFYETEGVKGLITAYISESKDGEYQMNALRIAVGGKKFVILGSFKTDVETIFARPMAEALDSVRDANPPDR